MDALLEGKRRLEATGVDVLGPTDHRFCQSIYFFDPNGIQLEMTARTETPGEPDRMERAAARGLIEVLSDHHPVNDDERTKLYQRHGWEVLGPNSL